MSTCVACECVPVNVYEHALPEQCMARRALDCAHHFAEPPELHKGGASASWQPDAPESRKRDMLNAGPVHPK